MAVARSTTRFSMVRGETGISSPWWSTVSDSTMAVFSSQGTTRSVSHTGSAIQSP